MPRLALVSALAESSTEVRLLGSHGFTVRVASSTSADVTLPGAGGSLAFLLLDAHSALAPAFERAVQAAKAARRCTILCVGNDAVAQPDVPQGVSVLHCETHEQAAEHMLACSQKVNAAGATTAAEELERAQHAATERVSAYLARLWGTEDTHQIDFLLAARPLGSLARVTSEEDWEQLCHATHGLVDHELLYVAVEWLQRDATQLDW